MARLPKAFNRFTSSARKLKGSSPEVPTQPDTARLPAPVDVGGPRTRQQSAAMRRPQPAEIAPPPEPEPVEEKQPTAEEKWKAYQSRVKAAREQEAREKLIAAGIDPDAPPEQPKPDKMQAAKDSLAGVRDKAPTGTIGVSRSALFADTPEGRAAAEKPREGIDAKTGERIKMGTVTPEEGEARREYVDSMNNAATYINDVTSDINFQGKLSGSHVTVRGSQALHDNNELSFGKNSTKDGTIATYRFNGQAFDVNDINNYPSDFVRELERQGTTPEAFREQANNVWINKHFQGASEEERAVMQAAMNLNGQGGVFVDQTTGITDRNGNVIATWGQVDNAFDDNTIYEASSDQVRMVVDEMRRALPEKGEIDQAQVNEAEAAKQWEERLLETMEMAEGIDEIDPEELLQENRNYAAMQNARALRLNMNRMARSGASPDAIQGVSAQLDQQNRAALAQQEAQIKFQTEVQNIQNKMGVLDRQLNIYSQLYANAQNSEQAEQAWARAQAAQREMMYLQQLQQDAQNKFNLGRTLGMVGIQAVGTMLGGVTGGLGAAAGSALASSLFGGGGGAQSMVLPQQPMAGTSVRLPQSAAFQNFIPKYGS